MLYKGQSTHGSFTLAEHLPKPFQCKLSAASDLRGREYYEQDDTSTVISASKVNVPTKPLCQTCAVNKWCRTSITHKIRTSVRFRVWNNTTEECFCKDTVLKISLQRCHLHAPHKARSSAIKLHPADEREGHFYLSMKFFHAITTTSYRKKEKKKKRWGHLCEQTCFWRPRFYLYLALFFVLFFILVECVFF